MKTLITLFYILFFVSTCFGQTANDTSYCERNGCKFPKNYPAHFDPYYNGHLCENFNPLQIDFSKEYYLLQTKEFSKESDQLQKLLNYDFSSIWNSKNLQQNGVIGFNYQRIIFHIDKVTKSENKPNTYIVSGKSKVKDNIFKFSGEIKLLNLFIISCDDTSLKNCGDLFCSYTFYEDSLQNHSGIFEGIMECSIHVDSINTKILLDESFDGADGYWNRSFIGTWTDYKTKQSKKCIWGDYRLPFVFDFMCGDGEMKACEKYIMNGWQSFNDNSEYDSVNEKWELKNKWWLTK